MDRNAPLTALCSAMPLASLADGDVPEWVHLLPAGEVRTVDGRGPYRVNSLQAIAASSLKPGEKLPLDENHATDKAAALGLSSPARGWIVELQARDDGLWGRVEWTAAGRELMADKAYRGISPAILHTKNNQVVGVLRASLTNTPNLQGLVALHSNTLAETNTMDWKAKLIELLGLDSTADDAAIETALMGKMSGGVALCAADLVQLPQFVALQSQLADVTAKYNSLVEADARSKAEAFVDAAIAEGRVGIKPARDEYVALHMENAERARALIAGMPVLKGGAIIPEAKVETADTVEFGSEDRLIMSLFGVAEDEYTAGLKAAGLIKEIL
jgi:phage I-like protein